MPDSNRSGRLKSASAAPLSPNLVPLGLRRTAPDAVLMPSQGKLQARRAHRATSTYGLGLPGLQMSLCRFPYREEGRGLHSFARCVRTPMLLAPQGPALGVAHHRLSQQPSSRQSTRSDRSRVGPSRNLLPQDIEEWRMHCMSARCFSNAVHVQTSRRLCRDLVVDAAPPAPTRRRVLQAGRCHTRLWAPETDPRSPPPGALPPMPTSCSRRSEDGSAGRCWSPEAGATTRPGCCGTAWSSGGQPPACAWPRPPTSSRWCGRCPAPATGRPRRRP